MRLLPFFLPPLAALAVGIAAIAPAADSNDRGPGIAGERRGEAMVYPVSGFERVSIGGPAAADIRVGPAFSLRITGPAAAVARLRVVAEKGRLEIGPRLRNAKSTREDQQVRIAITLPRLTDVGLGGSGSVTVDRVTGETFGAALGGSGSLRIARLDVAKATISIGGSGQIDAAGTARTLAVNLGGSGDFDAPDLRAASASIAAAGSGSVRARVDGEAEVTLVGSGSVDLGPGAKCRVTRMGSGTVRCGR